MTLSDSPGAPARGPALSSLVVPVGVEALCVGPKTDQSRIRFVGASADFSDLPRRDPATGLWAGKPYLGESIARFPRPTLQSGVHLHWALPDALTHGANGTDGKLRFPSAPNRWLVMRLRAGTTAAGDPASSARAWVIESDYLDTGPDKGGVSVPFRRDGSDQYHRYLGRAVPLEEWHETAASGSCFKVQTGEPLTAIGYGEATFAAYYPNCRNVFGFHDGLSDLADAGPGDGTVLSYLVAGWYSDPALDPVAGTALAAGGNALGWAFPGRADERPTRTLCSGLLRGLRWDPAADYFQDAAGPVDIAVGNTTSECVSALIANRPELADDADAAFILDAVQLGLLGSGWHPDQLARIEEEIHSASFAAVPGGTLWQIRPPRDAAAGDAAQPASPKPPVPLGPDLAAKLAAANGLQQAYDRMRFEADSRRQALFLDWYRLMRLVHGADDRSIDAALPALADPRARGALVNALRAYLDNQQDALQSLEDARGTLILPEDGSAQVSAGASSAASIASRLALALADVGAALSRDGDAALQLHQGAAARFWEANEPVMLLAGADVRPPLRYGGDGGHTPTGELACRLSSDILTALTAGSGAAAVNLGTPELLPAIVLAEIPATGDIAALLTEAVLTDPAHVALLAARLRAKAGADLPIAPTLLEDALREAQQAAMAGTAPSGPFVWRGTVPSRVGVTDWQGNPWLPLFLDWELTYQAAVTPPVDDEDFAADAVTARYGFDDDRIDLAHRNALPAREQTLRGVTLLTQNAFGRLTDSIGKLLQSAPDPALQAVADKLSAQPMLSHVFNGFNRTLLTRDRAIQLEVFDPLSPRDRDRCSALRDAIGEHGDHAPLPLDPFHGLRAGFLRVESLTLIDAFGRLKPIDLSQARLARARNLLPTDPALAANRFVHLPPRLAQPARLNFELLACGDDTTESNAATSPIFGWLLVNHFDPGLAIYDADGTALGMLRLVGGSTETVWQPAPTAGRPVADPADRAGMRDLVRSGIADRHLADLVLGALDHPEQGRFLATLLHAIDRTLETILPERANPDQGMGLFIGRPLALVRASLSLEIMGRPGFSTSWPSLARDVAAPATDAPDAPPPGAIRNDRGLGHVAFEVRLGDLRQIDDGLVGYFLDRTGDGRGYGRFFAPVTDAVSGSVVSPAADPILLTASPQAAPQRLTLLLDPHAAVHASTGILPVKSVEIPSELYGPALARLGVAFLCSPVLAPAGALRLPLPMLPGLAWRWLQAGPTGWTGTDGIAGAGERALASYSPQRIVEGWLQLGPESADPVKP